MTTHELETGQTVIVDVVPRTAKHVELHEIDRTWHLVYCDPKEIRVSTGVFKDFKVELIGTIQHPGVFSFDPEPFVEKLGSLYVNHQCSTFFWDKNENGAQKSFLSRLASWGYYWDNPLGEKPQVKNDENPYNRENNWIYYEKDLAAWQQAESRKLSVEQMVVVILIKKV